MGSPHQVYINLDDCINAYIDESEQSVHKYFKLFNIAVRAVTELGLDFFYQIKSVKLPVNANLTVTLPADFLQYSKIGVLNQQGEIIPLSYNSKLTTFSDLQPTRLEQTQDPSIPTLLQFNTPIWYNYWGDGTYSNLYGLPSGSPFVGSFKMDIQNGVILLNENFGYDYLMVEYVASPKQGETYYVPIQFKEAIIAYLRWKDIISIPSKTHVNNANVGMRRHEYFNERRLANARYNPVDLIDAYEWNLQQQRLTVKM